MHYLMTWSSLKNRQIWRQTLVEVLEQNNVLLKLERDKLEKWAEAIWSLVAEEATTRYQNATQVVEARSQTGAIDRERAKSKTVKSWSCLERQRRSANVWKFWHWRWDRRTSGMNSSVLLKSGWSKNDITELFPIRWKVILIDLKEKIIE